MFLGGTMVRLFVVGMGEGGTTDLFVDMFKDLNIEYKIYGFEPAKDAYNFLIQKYRNNKNISVLQNAVSDFEGPCKLYNTPNPDGKSICIAKWNVNRNSFENCSTIKFSDWFNSLDTPLNDVYIVTCDIEGSEYEFYKDLIESGVSSKIDLFCGLLNDLYKIGKPHQEADAFVRYMQINGVNVVELSTKNLNNIQMIKNEITNKIDENAKAVNQLTEKTVESVEPVAVDDQPIAPWFEPVDIKSTESVKEIPKKKRGRPKTKGVK